MFGVNGLNDADARTHTLAQCGGKLTSGSQTPRSCYDVMSIADPEIALPKIDPHARRRGLDRFGKHRSLGPRKPGGLNAIEDAHWIDEVSESLIADFLTVIPQTPSLVLITYRPEYLGRIISGGWMRKP